MYQVQAIENFEHPDLAPYRTMRRQMEHRQQNFFVAEGEKVVRRLLDSPFEVVSVLLPEKWFQELEPVLRQRPEQLKVFVAPKPLLETLTGFSMYQGLLAVGRVPVKRKLPELLSQSPRPWFFAAVDGLSSAQNIGAIVRNCAALGVHGFITTGESSSPFLRRAVRASMGAAFQVPMIETDDLLPAMRLLQSHGVKCIAAHPHVHGCDLYDADLRSDVCIILGSEGYGISAPVLAACDGHAAIPMEANVDSLNVASAASVFFYEVRRQRRRQVTTAGYCRGRE